MGIFGNMAQKIREKREMRSQMETQQRIVDNMEMKRLSPVEREYNKYQEEERQKALKSAVEKFRKARQHEINFGHNALDVKNVTNGKATVLKQKNIFRGRCMFTK